MKPSSRSWLRLAPSVLVVFCWFLIQDRVEIITDMKNPQRVIAVLGVILTAMPLAPYIEYIARRPPKDIWIAGLVSILAFLYTVAALFTVSAWSGRFLD